MPADTHTLLKSIQAALGPVIADLESLSNPYPRKLRSAIYVLKNLARAEPVAVPSSAPQWKAALERIWNYFGDCQCEHDDENCCAMLGETEYCCPTCIAAIALGKHTIPSLLASAPVAVPAPKCVDCGAPLNEGEAKTFTCCDACWEKTYPPRVEGAVQAAPPSEPVAFTIDARCDCAKCVARTENIYRMLGHCLNCGQRHILMLFRAGDPATSRDCPRCGKWHGVEPQRLATDDEIPAAAPSAAAQTPQGEK